MNDPCQDSANSPSSHRSGDAAARWGRTWVEVNPEALRRNWRRVAARLPQGGFGIACIKKDGYGHGLVTVARALAAEPGVWGMGVATLEEAIGLRQAGRDEMRNAECGMRNKREGGPSGGSGPSRAMAVPPDLPILVLVPLTGAALEEAVRLQLTLTVTDLDEASAADRAAAGQNTQVRAHLKLDTGMGRLGRLPDEVAGQWPAIRALPHVRLEAVFSHLADGWRNPVSRQAQLEFMEHFRTAAGIAAGDPPVHWGGSDALAFSDRLAPGDGLRVGIALYGDHPAADFEPAMTFKTRVVYRRRVPAGTPVSYGSTFTTARASELAVIGAGYGNGLLRALSGKGADVLIAGRRCPLLGRVCMDQAVADVTDLVGSGARVETGDEVVLFGLQQAPGGSLALLPAAEQAASAGTISYELFCLAGQLNPRRIGDSGWE